MVFTDLYKRAREGLRSNEYLGVHSNGVEQLDDITRSHANASEADGLSDVSLLGCAVDVDVARKGVAVPSFKALEPQDARHDRIAAGSIHWQYLAGRDAAFENSSGRHVIADLFSDAELSERRGVGAPGIAESEFRVPLSAMVPTAAVPAASVTVPVRPPPATATVPILLTPAAMPTMPVPSVGSSTRTAPDAVP